MTCTKRSKTNSDDKKALKNNNQMRPLMHTKSFQKPQKEFKGTHFNQCLCPMVIIIISTKLQSVMEVLYSV